MDVEFVFDPKATVASLLLIARAVRPDKYTACKLLFLADRLHLVRYGRTITGSAYYALPHGPVPSQALDMLNYVIEGRPLNSEWLREIEGRFGVEESQYPSLIPKLQPDLEQLSTSDAETINETVSRYGTASDFGELYNLTHAMPAYRLAIERGGASKNPRILYEDFFKDNPDVVAGAFEEMIENWEIRLQHQTVACGER
ncbi:MAG: Panacea domain-containing protein [Terriglobales bacterium]